MAEGLLRSGVLMKGITRASFTLVDERKTHGDERPFPWLAIDGDGAAVLLDNPLANG